MQRLILLFIVTLLTACTSPQTPRPAPPTLPKPDQTNAPLRGTWQLVNMTGTSNVQSADIIMRFDEQGSAITGSYLAGCHLYTADYTLTDSNISFSNIYQEGSTCTYEEMPREPGMFFEALTEVTTYFHTRNGSLRLEGPDTTLSFRPTSLSQQQQPATSSLSGSRWQLDSMDDAPLTEGTRITLAFAALSNTYRGDGCTDYRGTYSLDDGTFSARLTNDNRTCERDSGQWQRYLTRLHARNTVTFPDPATMLLSSDDGTLTFTADDLPEEALSQRWLLASINGEAIDMHVYPPTINFHGGGFYTGNQCLAYWAAYTLDDTTIQLFDATIQRQRCLPADAALMEGYAEGLNTVTTLTATANTLTLSGPGVEYRYSPQAPPIPMTETPHPIGPLDDNSWRLVSFNGQPPIDIEPTTFTFEEPRAIIIKSCNTFSAGYLAAPPEIIVAGFSPANRRCGAIIDRQEQQIREALLTITTLSLQGDTLTLSGPETELVLEAIPRQTIPTPTPQQQNRAPGTYANAIRGQWRLTSIDRIPARTDITIQFGEYIEGTAFNGCIEYGFNYWYTQDGLFVGYVGERPFTCDTLTDDDLLYMARYYKILRTATSLDINANGALIISGPQGTLTYTREDAQ